MTKTFFCVKREAAFSLGSPDGKRSHTPPALPPRLTIHPTEGTSMCISPEYRKMPHVHERVKELKTLILIDRACVSDWEASNPPYPLLPRVKEQIRDNEKLLAEITGAGPCQ